MEEKMTIIERADLGPVIARADHLNNAIDVNRRIFYAMPPMVQEYVLCHEVCHLRYNEWDEARTNRLACDLFMQRSANDDDRARRERFLSYLDGTGQSNISVSAIIAAATAAIGLGTTIWGVIRERNAYWYSWDEATRRSNLDLLLTQAFEDSRRTSSQSAAQLFWDNMQSFTNKDEDLEEFLNRSGNEWVRPVIAGYENRYGFDFEEVTPIDITAFPLAMLAIGIAVGVVVYYIIKKIRK